MAPSTFSRSCGAEMNEPITDMFALLLENKILAAQLEQAKEMCFLVHAACVLSAGGELVIRKETVESRCVGKVLTSFDQFDGSVRYTVTDAADPNEPLTYEAVECKVTTVDNPSETRQ